MKFFHSCVMMAALAAPAIAHGASLEPPADFDEAAWQAEWDAHDTDRDGRLSREEAVAGNPNVAEIFDEIDANGDGYISPEEDKAMLWRAQQKDALR
ncbi:calcium-binding EF-hand protein [Hyphomicrobium nitrativorans NL23]|uniref:Calcium-binding EF-hand protein n=1 Tax=Hyphomicrobium nitrativorans NL23 TaxID=1029756 RepID=V5SD58_9HYPH|nr:EF-hand domain-containing protein [Hyphomicrobium nitrativorans]AHB48801.1 calcium-binding EF-hand protein [Hyphomicrobium nitrativorans NL23]